MFHILSESNYITARDLLAKYPPPVNIVRIQDEAVIRVQVKGAPEPIDEQPTGDEVLKLLMVRVMAYYRPTDVQLSSDSIEDFLSASTAFYDDNFAMLWGAYEHQSMNYMIDYFSGLVIDPRTMASLKYSNTTEEEYYVWGQLSSVSAKAALENRKLPVNIVRVLGDMVINMKVKRWSSLPKPDYPIDSEFLKVLTVRMQVYAPTPKKIRGAYSGQSKLVQRSELVSWLCKYSHPLYDTDHSLLWERFQDSPINMILDYFVEKVNAEGLSPASDYDEYHMPLRGGYNYGDIQGYHAPLRGD